MKVFSFVSIVIICTQVLLADSYYENAKLLEMSHKTFISESKLSYMKNDKKVYITNKLILKTLSSKTTAKYLEDKYSISLKKSYKNMHIFIVNDITKVVELCKKIYEEENVKYAQPSYLRKVKHHAIERKNTSMDKPMTKKITLHSNENTNSMLDSENSVNYYKYYDDVFRYEDDSFWHLYNNGGWETTAGIEGHTYDITSNKDVDTGILNVIDSNITGKGVRVLVVDSSFELTHPDLRFSYTYNFNLSFRT